MTYDAVALYDAARQHIAGIVQSLSDAELSRVVPGTPKWTVHDLLAHLAGLATDVQNDNLAGAGTEAWTQAQVDARRDRSVAELLAEWERNAPAVHGALSGDPPRLPFAVDAVTHEHDLRAAVGRVDSQPAEDVRFAIAMFSTGAKRGIVERGLPPLRLVATDTDVDRLLGDGDPGASVRAPAYELFRMLAGRRGCDQVRAFDWDGDPTPYLDVVCVFGALPNRDVLEPAPTLNV